MIINFANHTNVEPTVVNKRIKKRNRPSRQHILNVIDQGKADNSSPYFAASAIAQYVPFQDLTDILDKS